MRRWKLVKRLEIPRLEGDKREIRDAFPLSSGASGG
jgi:hypothetical protein